MFPCSALEFFSAWNDLLLDGDHLKLWKMSFYSILWSIWLFWNDMIFSGKIWDPFQLYDINKTRVAWWAKSKWSNLKIPLLDLFREPWLGSIEDSCKSFIKSVEWRRPNPNQVKFNVNEAASGCL